MTAIILAVIFSGCMNGNRKQIYRETCISEGDKRYGFIEWAENYVMLSFQLMMPDVQWVCP